MRVGGGGGGGKVNKRNSVFGHSIKIGTQLSYMMCVHQACPTINTTQGYKTKARYFFFLSN